MSVWPDPALIDCRAIICMALQASIRQLKGAVNEIFLRQECVFALASSCLLATCACVIRQRRARSEANSKITTTLVVVILLFSHHLMAGAVWCLPNIATSSSFALIHPTRLFFPNEFLFLLRHLPLYSFYLVPHTINVPRRSALR